VILIRDVEAANLQVRCREPDLAGTLPDPGAG
jgi:hypothetical protein